MASTTTGQSSLLGKNLFSMFYGVGYKQIYSYIEMEKSSDHVLVVFFWKYVQCVPVKPKTSAAYNTDYKFLVYKPKKYRLALYCLLSVWMRWLWFQIPYP